MRARAGVANFRREPSIEFIEKTGMIIPKRKHLASFAAAALLAICVPAFAAAPDATVPPDSPQAAHTITELERAAHIDRERWRSHLGGEDADLGIYYAEKAKEAEALERRLKSGGAVSQGEVDRALDTSAASHFRSY